MTETVSDDHSRSVRHSPKAACRRPNLERVVEKVGAEVIPGEWLRFAPCRAAWSQADAYYWYINLGLGERCADLFRGVHVSCLVGMPEAAGHWLDRIDGASQHQFDTFLAGKSVRGRPSFDPLHQVSRYREATREGLHAGHGRGRFHTRHRVTIPAAHSMSG
ncbi:MAG TPA: hypothetical protein VIU87_18035, partial [Mycobacterium sp.]